MVVPRFRNETDGIGFCIKQGGKAGIVGCRSSRPPRHAERRENRVKVAIFAEQFRIGRICTRIAAFNVIDPQFVEHGRDRQLVDQREIDAICLGAVAQGRVEEIHAFAGHGCPHASR